MDNKTPEDYWSRKDDTSVLPQYDTVLDQLEDIRYMLQAGKIQYAAFLVEDAILSQKRG